MTPFPESPRCLSPFQGNLFSLHCLDFKAEDRLTPRWHVGQPCGKASWESLVGKPRGKATDPLIHAKGSVTLLLQFERKAHVPTATREEDCLPWRDSRSPPRSMSALEWNPQVPAPTSHMVLGPGNDGRGNPRGPRATRMGTGLSSGHQSGSLRSPSKVESTCRNSRKSRRFSPPGEMRPITAETSRG